MTKPNGQAADATPLVAIPVAVDVDDRAALAPRSIRGADPAMLRRGERAKPPWRRPADRTEVVVGGCRVFVDISRGPDGKPLELFIDLPLHKDGAPLRTALNVVARLASLALQYGAPVEKVASLMRHVNFEPAGLVEEHEAIGSAKSIVDFVAQFLAIESRGGR